MNTIEASEFATCSKKVWAIYSLAVICLILILVFVVAQDNEEKLFYSLMAVAAAYVLRPSDRTIAKYVMRLFGVAPPAKAENGE